MEPDVGWWASAVATPDLCTVTVGRRTRRTTDCLNSWPVRYVQQWLNVRYRRTSVTTNDWTSDDDWDDRTSSEWTSDVGRLNIIATDRQTSNRGRIRPLKVGWMNLGRDNVSSRTSARTALVGQQNYFLVAEMLTFRFTSARGNV